VVLVRRRGSGRGLLAGGGLLLAIIASEPCFAQVAPSPEAPPPVVPPQVIEHPRRVVSFTFSPFQLVPPIYKVGGTFWLSELSGEIRVWERWGIGLFVGPNRQNLAFP
jgi:hypothetical protein